MADERVNSVVPHRVFWRKLRRRVEFHLPEELIFEILKRLPAESLIRFMSVSKSWCSLITNRSFVSAHVAHQSDSRTDDSISTIFHAASRFYLHRLQEPVDQWTEVDPPMDNLAVAVGCCHGVVCLYDYISEGIGPLILWNPSIRKALTLQFKEPSFHIAGLRMNNSASPNFTFGFGFDPVSSDYKVVRLVYNWVENSNTTYIHSDVCSLNNNDWRSTVTLVEGHNFRFECRGVYLNGAVHWMCMKRQEDAVISKTILTFDLVNEEIGEICLPMNVDLSTAALMSVTVVEDKLAVAGLDSGGNLWVMEEYGEPESWRILLSFCIGDNVGLIQRAVITGDGNTVLATSAGNWILWDSTNGEIENLSLPVLDPEYMSSYVPSLVLLRCRNRKLRFKDLHVRKRNNRSTKKRMTAREFKQVYRRMNGLAMLQEGGYLTLDDVID